ncbi:hypothetical protein [Spirosoma litoris]
MVLTQERQQRLTERLDALKDIGGASLVAEKAGVTLRVIQKAQSGGNVKVSTMESITAALLLAESERNLKVSKIEDALA